MVYSHVNWRNMLRVFFFAFFQISIASAFWLYWQNMYIVWPITQVGKYRFRSNFERDINVVTPSSEKICLKCISSLAYTTQILLKQTYQPMKITQATSVSDVSSLPSLQRFVCNRCAWRTRTQMYIVQRTYDLAQVSTPS